MKVCIITSPTQCNLCVWQDNRKCVCLWSTCGKWKMHVLLAGWGLFTYDKKWVLHTFNLEIFLEFLCINWVLVVSENMFPVGHILCKCCFVRQSTILRTSIETWLFSHTYNCKRISAFSTDTSPRQFKMKFQDIQKEISFE